MFLFVCRTYYYELLFTLKIAVMKCYFKLEEFLTTSYDVKLRPSSYHRDNLKRLMYSLNVVRGFLAMPIIVTSGYRTEELNDLVGGVQNSYHLVGRAADITCNDMHRLFQLCSMLYDAGIFVECIHYPKKNYIHVAI